MQNEITKILISVVIPVYNVAPYISRCIESLKAQSFKAMEFIFIDDCSEDKSMELVERWAAEDSRVIILRNERNMGAGIARNKGLEAARGTYINAIDPDDRVSPDYYELLYAKAVQTSADIVKGTRIKIEERTSEEITPRSNLNTIIDDSLTKGEPLYLSLRYEHMTLLFKRSLLDDEIRYGKSSNGEDATFLLLLCTKANSYALEENAYYYYLQRKGSSTGEFSLKRSENELISYKEYLDFFVKQGTFDDYVYRYCAIFFNTYLTRFIFACENEQLPLQEREKYKSELKAQILRIPNNEKLYQIEPAIRAFVEFDLMLTSELSMSPSVRRQQMADWINCILALKGTGSEKAGNRLKYLLVSYISKRQSSGISFKELEEECTQIAAELEELKQKLTVYYIVKSACSLETGLNYQTLRIDVLLSTQDFSNEGIELETIELNDTRAKLSTPEWFQKNGKGYVLESVSRHIKWSLRCTKPCKMKVFLRSKDVRDEFGKRISYEVDIEDLTINGQRLLNDPTIVTHSKPYEYVQDIKPEKDVCISVSWQVREG